MPEGIRSDLARLRKQRGISAAGLATLTGTSRQTIYAVEAGTYVPNTALALKMAKALETNVEEIFALEEEPASAPVIENATLIPGSASPHPGQPARVCRVDERLVAFSPAPVPWYFPASDGVFTGPAAGKQRRVQLFSREVPAAPRLLVAGCDPAISVLARHALAAGVELAIVHRNSTQSLGLLRQNSVHIAGTHLRDDATGESNLPAITRAFGKNPPAVVSYAVWEEGILTAPLNPKSIRSVADFARGDVVIVNREAGAGSRKLLDAQLKRFGIHPSSVGGYDTEAPGHLAAAWQVRSGGADACIATQAAARLFGLEFTPVAAERYDLVIRPRDLDMPSVRAVLDTLCRARFRRELETLCGYDTRVAGRRLL